MTTETITSSDPKTESVSNQNIDDMVKYETHRKLLGQHKKSQQENVDLLERIKSFEIADNERSEGKLAEQGEHKKIIELRETKIKELQESLQLEQKSRVESDEKIMQTWKLQAFYSKLPGKIKKNDYLAHAKLEDIVFDKETMVCDDQSVEAVVNKFMEDHSELVLPSQAKKLPANATNTITNIENMKDKKTASQLLTEGLTQLG